MLIKYIKIALKAVVAIVIIGLSITVSCQGKTIEKAKAKALDTEAALEACSNELKQMQHLKSFIIKEAQEDDKKSAAAIKEIENSDQRHERRLNEIELAKDDEEALNWSLLRVPAAFCELFNAGASDCDRVRQNKATGGIIDGMQSAGD